MLRNKKIAERPTPRRSITEARKGPRIKPEDYGVNVNLIQQRYKFSRR